MIKDILEYLESQPPETVSFAELALKVNGFNGSNFIIFSPLNCILWPHASQNGTLAIIFLMQRGIIGLNGCQPFVYAANGFISPFPIINPEREKPYKHPNHFFPTVLFINNHDYDIARLQELYKQDLQEIEQHTDHTTPLDNQRKKLMDQQLNQGRAKIILSED